jgi:hypothetical protein
LTSLRASSPFAQESSGSADDELTGSDRPADTLDEVEAMIRVKTQKLQQATGTMIDEADAYSAEQPEYAESLLKDLLESIQSAHDVPPEAREELERRVTSAISAVQNRRDQVARAQQANAVRRAVEEAQNHLISQQEVLETDLQVIIDQVRGLLERARHGDTDSY